MCTRRCPGTLSIAALMLWRPPARRDRHLALPALAGLEAAFLLDHDVVPGELAVLTAIGTFFRGPGWSWVWPWRS